VWKNDRPEGRFRCCPRRKPLLNQPRPSRKRIQFMASPKQSHHRYWHANLLVLGGLLVVWFLFSCVLSIFLVDWLNQFKLGGFPLGFWIAQQGTIYVFIVLIITYVLIMKKLDRKYDVEEEQE
jgi:putative solute:sodium symporter small subunit